MPLLQGGVGSRHQEGEATGAGDPGSPWQWGDLGLQSMDSRAKCLGSDSGTILSRLCNLGRVTCLRLGLPFCKMGA